MFVNCKKYKSKQDQEYIKHYQKKKSDAWYQIDPSFAVEGSHYSVLLWSTTIRGQFIGAPIKPCR